MLGRIFSRGSQAFAINDGKGLFIHADYDARERFMHVDYALQGPFGETLGRGVVEDIPARYRSRPVWVPVFVENIGQQNDIRVVGIDVGDDDSSYSAAVRLADTQLREVEADERVNYVHAVASHRGANGTDWIGGSIPASIMNNTFEYWRRQRKGQGFRRPRIGSRHVGIANLFLAFHHEAGKGADGYTLLSHWTENIDLFCLMKGETFIDCGNSAAGASATFDSHMDHLSSWARAFVERRRIADAEGLRACVICSGKAEQPADYEIDPSKLEFWEFPWDRVKCASASVEAELMKDPELALSAIGLALHGI